MAFLYKRGPVFYVGYVASGRQKGMSTGCTQLKDARKALVEFEANHKNPDRYRNMATLPWADMWARYEAFSTNNHKPNTVAARRTAYNQAGRAFAPKTIADITPQRIEAYKASWRAEGKNPVTFNDFKRSMSTITDWAIENGLFSGPNPWKGVRELPQPKPIKPVLSADKYDMVIREAPDSLKPALVLGLYFGLRKGEINACRWEWFDWGTKHLTVYQDDGFTTKSGRNRSVPIFDVAGGWLAPVRLGSGYVVPDPNQQCDKRYRTNFDRDLDVYMDTLTATHPDIPRLTPHQMRHSFCSNALRAGATIYDVALWMGHSATRITEEYRQYIPANESARRLFG